MKPIQTISKFFSSPKDPITQEEQSCLIYLVPCLNCEFIYIGQTKRDLKTRLSEHKRAIKFQRPEKSALCQHTIVFDHKINWDQARILKLETDYFKRLTAESWFINVHSNVMNRSDGDYFPAVYRSLF